MSYINKSMIAPYNIQYMFELINDVNKYSKFFPWCTSSRILKKNNNIFICEIQLSFLGFKEILITQNTCIKYVSINIQLISGKFSSFKAEWKFLAINSNTTKIKFELMFNSNQKYINKCFNLFLKKKLNSIMYLFLQEANYRSKLK
ncbi:oligoketide cyclase [Wigglesworthia glossinidia endosymbiont of Glossina morsitans morsitans (Yale colony)]|uniref:Oligoketide cyclase n=1 Tax=Wigglesworthia glossinidia endosymbiont of Glossina morsitans morsitans (Yale colony) TaxID=1142511 RepID=H6Q5S2_WIGGL|nr:type II toxin-antitoxin system RatA family toxin [Wigglesworthia glossinidia]AFA40977.1 oligoketide cyclase [Wigglesworthia glossinidia endosymbiont of Glossina morsitans morsitans (Yale colony)]